MRQEGLSRPIRLLLTALVILAASAAADTVNREATELIDRGREALNAGRPEEALRLFQAGREHTDDSETNTRIDFYQGVAYQQLALSQPEGDEASARRRDAYLGRAEHMYQAFLEVHPDSGPAANNLAKVYRALGDPERSASYYQRALETDDDNRGLYLKNYAEMLDEAGEWSGATEVYSRMIREEPLSGAVQQSMARSYTTRGLDDLAGYLWELLESGYSRQAAELAIDALATSGDEPDEVVGELMAVIAQGMSKSTYDPRDFAETVFGQRLIRELLPHPQAGPPAKTLLVLHRGVEFAPASYRWWTAYYDRRQDPVRGVWGTDAFRSLARSLGTRFESRGDFATAGAYFTLAADLHPAEVDPAAVGALARMYIQQDQLGKIHETLDTYERTLFAGKGVAIMDMRESELAYSRVAESTYRDSRVKKTYEYHRTLGEIYAAIGQWGSSDRVDSAIFQLEQALRQSRTLESRVGDELPRRYQATPEMVDTLAHAYVVTDRVVEGDALRVEAAEIYRSRGDEAAAEQVLEPVKMEVLDPSLQRRIEALEMTPVVNRGDGGPR